MRCWPWHLKTPGLTWPHLTSHGGRVALGLAPQHHYNSRPALRRCSPYNTPHGQYSSFLPPCVYPPLWPQYLHFLTPRLETVTRTFHPTYLPSPACITFPQCVCKVPLHQASWPGNDRTNTTVLYSCFSSPDLHSPGQTIPLPPPSPLTSPDCRRRGSCARASLRIHLASVQNVSSYLFSHKKNMFRHTFDQRVIGKVNKKLQIKTKFIGNHINVVHLLETIG